MQEITVTPLEALYRLIGAASMIDSAECKDEAIYNTLQGELAVAKEVAKALAMAPKQEAPTQEPFHHYGLCAEQLQQLLNGGLKPEEISGAADVQHDRVHELVWWFSRLTQGNANTKWAVRHACELAYFVAINGVNSRIDLKAIRDAAFKEGVNITPEERGTLERIGFAIPRAIPIAAPAAANGAPELPALPKADVEGGYYDAESGFTKKAMQEYALAYGRAILAAAGPDAAPPALELAAEQLAEYCENMGYESSYVDDVRAALSGAKGN